MLFDWSRDLCYGLWLKTPSFRWRKRQPNTTRSKKTKNKEKKMKNKEKDEAKIKKGKNRKSKVISHVDILSPEHIMSVCRMTSTHMPRTWPQSPKGPQFQCTQCTPCRPLCNLLDLDSQKAASRVYPGVGKVRNSA